MQRHVIVPRADWQERAAQLGFDYANIEDGSYWDESACWQLTADEVDMLEAATLELERLCHLAMAHAIDHDLDAELGLPPVAWAQVKASWRRAEPSLYGRMDLRWDGVSAPKLLEYNADTPTTLYEASVVQWEWLVTTHPGMDQFNSLHEALIARWGEMNVHYVQSRLHFASMRGWLEDKATVDYLRDTAVQAGIETEWIAIEDIGWDGRRFMDLAPRPIEAIFKLYPWDWLLRDKFGAHLAGAATRWIEPAWRLALASKGILAILWRLFPDHPNLLPAYREPHRVVGPVIKKPLLGREGANITAPGHTTAGFYGDEGFLYQSYVELPCYDGKHPVFGSWIVGGRPCGIGIREDPTPITRDTSAFVPHYFDPRT